MFSGQTRSIVVDPLAGSAHGMDAENQGGPALGFHCLLQGDWVLDGFERTMITADRRTPGHLTNSVKRRNSGSGARPARTGRPCSKNAGHALLRCGVARRRFSSRNPATCSGKIAGATGETVTLSWVRAVGWT